MFHRAIPVVSLIVLSALIGAPPAASADREPEKPSTPKNIDQTPPLVPIPNARVTKTGLLVGGQPSLDQLKAIAQAGYRTVITLRTDMEQGDEGEEATVERLGMKFVSIPVAGPAGLTEDNARRLAKALEAQDALPAVLHCKSGQRVSALLGLKAFVVDRVSAAAAIDLAKSLGLTKLEAALRQRIAEICKADKSRNCEGVQ
ncbi:MAG: sulfur transferase domain-containing protein [Polyangiales bacterium]